MKLDFEQTAIAVTGLSAADNPAPGVAVARSLRDGGHKGRLIGLAYDTMDTGLYNRDIFDEIYMIPYPSAGSEALLERLKAIHADGGLDVVLPTLDSEMELYLSLSEELSELGVGHFLPDERSLALRAKSRLAAFCEKNDFLAPPTRVVFDHVGMQQAFAELIHEAQGEPVYVKGVYYDARKAYTLEQATAAYNAISSRWGLPIILQRGLKGFEYNVCCLGDGQGGLIGAVPMRKLGVTDKGKAWSGVTVGDPRLRKLSESIIGALEWRGPCELEILCEDGTNKLYLIEINPRFPAWCYLCTGAGQNLPKAQARMAMGERLDALDPCRSGVIYSRAAVDIICDLQVLEELSMMGRSVYEEREEK
jgi:carbamoyl-phosphate synthase large subunit